MALVPQPDGSLALIDDVSGLPVADGVPPDMLGSLYQPGAVALPAAPPPENDQRIAANDAPVPQHIRDYVMNRLDAPTPQPGYGSHVPGPQALPTQPARRLVGPESAPAPTGPATPAAAPSPSGLPETGRVQDSVSDFVRTEALKAMQPRGGAVVSKPERDVLRNFTVQQAPKLSEEAKLDRDLAAVKQQVAAADAGMLQRAAHDDAALMYEKRRTAAQQEIAGIRDQERQRDQVVGARMRELDMMGEELRTKRKGATNPDAYWEDKGELAHAFATIGQALYAAGAMLNGADPMGLAKQIDSKIDRYNQAKRLEVELVGQEIDEKRTQLGEVRKQFLSRDAAEQATRALMNEAMAAETASMAESYKSAGAQATAQQLIAQLQAQAAEARAAAELAEKDAVTQAWQHMEAQRGVVGGSPGGIAGLQKLAKQTGIPVMDLMRATAGQGLPISDEQLKVAQLNKSSTGGGRYAEHREKGVVQLPEGGFAYHPNPDVAKAKEKILSGIAPWQGNLKQMKQILTGVGTASKLSPDARGTLNVLQAQSVPFLKAVAEEAMTTGEDIEFWSKLRGKSANELMSWMSDEAQLDQAIKATEQYDRSARSVLRKLPAGIDPGEPLVRPVQSKPEETK